MLVILIQMILKANIFSFVYLIFIIKFFLSESKVVLLIKINYYVGVLLVVQYTMFLLNLTSATSPQPFPYLLNNYPHIYDYEDFKFIPYGLPLFYRYAPFRDLNLSYFLGVGVSAHQIENLINDFIIMLLISMYVYNFRNPLFFKEMEKVFWAFPNEFDSSEKWQRLKPDVMKQHKWLMKPYPL